MLETTIPLASTIIGKEISRFSIVVSYTTPETYLGYGKLVKLINMTKKKFFLITM